MYKGEIMEEKDIVIEIEKETREIERLLKVLKAYYIEEYSKVDIPTTILPTLELILEKIDNLKNNYIKLKSD